VDPAKQRLDETRINLARAPCRASSRRSPSGWLSVVGLDWLAEGVSVSVGSAADNNVRVDHCSPHLGVFHLNSGKVTITPPAGGFPGTMQIDGERASAQTLRAYYASDNPSTIRDNPITIYILSDSGKLGLSIWDTKSSTRLQFHGLQYFPLNPKYVIHARWLPYNPPRVETHTSVLGLRSKFTVPGAAEFVLEGKRFRVEPLEMSDTILQFPVADGTSGSTTYGGGRFLDTDYPSKGLQHPGEIVLDMNKLSNPPCAFAHYVNCTLAPDQNRISIKLNVGEKKY
jgi:uncharacterized protein (DUF1684 family)